MTLRYRTPLFALSLVTLLPAADRPEGERQGPPPGPPVEALFERFDQDKSEQLSRQEFARGMIELRKRRAEGGERPRFAAEGEGRPPRPAGEGEGKPPREGEGKPPGEGEGRPPRPSGDGEGGSPLEAAFNQADADKSSSLTMDEFRAALQSLPRSPDKRPPGQGEGERPRPPKDN